MSNFNLLLSEALDRMEIEDLVKDAIRNPDDNRPIRRLKEIASKKLLV